MFSYILKRLLLFIPTLFIISVITFFISANAPGDILRLTIEDEYDDSPEILHHFKLQELPQFYFVFSSLAMPDTLYLIPRSLERKVFSRMVDLYGNKGFISGYRTSFKKLERAVYQTKPDSSNAEGLILIKNNMIELSGNYTDELVRQNFMELRKTISSSGSFLHIVPLLEELINSYKLILKNKTVWKKFIPVIYFYGLNNQYHLWVTNFLQGDFGISYQDKRPVATVIWDAMKITLLISCLAIFITYMIAIPLGVIAASSVKKLKDKTITTLVFIIYSLPSFWMATLLIMFLGGGDYLNWFPSYGLSSASSNSPVLEKILDTGYHLVLPLICWVLPSLAYIVLQTRGGMLNVLHQDYIRTARAKGLPESKVIWKHSFRNSLLPIITLFARVFPLAISGAVVLENIFSIPGMGKLAYEAVIYRNYPVVFTVMMFASVMSLIGYLVADILYAVADPRITYKQHE